MFSTMREARIDAPQGGVGGGFSHGRGGYNRLEVVMVPEATIVTQGDTPSPTRKDTFQSLLMRGVMLVVDRWCSSWLYSWWWIGGAPLGSIHGGDRRDGFRNEDGKGGHHRRTFERHGGIAREWTRIRRNGRLCAQKKA